MFYQKYVRLCNELNKGLTTVAKEAGLKSTGTVSGWKDKGPDFLPHDSTLSKLSFYFTKQLGHPITVEYLKGKEPKQKEKTINQMADGLTEEKRKAIEIIMNASDENARKYLRMIETFEGIE